MRRVAFAAIFVVSVVSSACGGCGDTAGTANSDSPNSEQQACEDADGDGWEAGLTCEGQVDCDDDDPDVNPDAEEVCDGVDNDCDLEIDEDCETCDDEGATRECGQETGRCQVGTQTCEDGIWTLCVGSEGPFTEECNGEDDDCDGEVDEGGDLLCDDGFQCNGTEVCMAGECVEGEPVDCSEFDGPCSEGVCSEKDGGCKAAPLANGSPCDDGNFCTTGGVCQSGVCETTPRDCSGEDDQCNVGVCDEDAGACVKEPLMDGTMCDDGEFCTVDDVCTMGVCGGPDRDCSGVADQCNTGECDEMADECVPQPVADDTPCDDGLYCNVDETCQTGACTGGTMRSCTAQGGSCRTGMCDEATDSCTGDPVDDGTPCDDSQFCTVMDNCQAGTCVGGGMRDCSGADGVCQVGMCDETLNACTPEPADDGDPCDDGLFCTTVDTCLSGSCVGGGPEPDCSGVVSGSNPCEIGTCDMMADMCVATFDPTCCDVNVDNDLDGYNECEDCDDANASVNPAGTEVCNGVDDDCDGAIDEDFDADSDGFSVCSDDPDLRDCDDQDPNVNPGMMEICDDGAGGTTGNMIDDDCDGYVDEGCDPCTTDDVDGDGSTECDGDCDDNDPEVYPGNTEVCDDKDNDCNAFTVANCDVSETCNHDLDGDVSNDPDQCMDDQVCTCILANNGDCMGDYVCTSYCNSSRTGPIGDGCESDQACILTFTGSANVNGCSVISDPLGTLRGGEFCGSADECRSGLCRKPNCMGPGCNQKFCHDRCTSDSECAATAVCKYYHFPASVIGRETVFANCEPQSLSSGGDVGDSCSGDLECARRACMTDPNDGSQYCTQLCCTDSDCGAGAYCSFEGAAERATTSTGDLAVLAPDQDGPSCSDDADCTGEGGICFNGECTYPRFATSGQCVTEVAGQGTNRGGQACAQNSDCRSNFCEKDLGICVEPCCADSTCPMGTLCETAAVESRDDEGTLARVCLSFSIDDTLERM